MKHRHTLFLLLLTCIILIFPSCGEKEKAAIIEIGPAVSETISNANVFNACGLNYNKFQIDYKDSSEYSPVELAQIAVDDEDYSTIIFLAESDLYDSSIRQFMDDYNYVSVYFVDRDTYELVDSNVGNDIDESEEYEESADDNAGYELTSRGAWDSEDANGYIVHGEITTTGLIKAENWEAAKKTFDNLSPSQELPDFESIAPQGAAQETSAILIGVISLENKTEGWDFSEDSPYSYRLCFGENKIAENHNHMNKYATMYLNVIKLR